MKKLLVVLLLFFVFTVNSVNSNTNKTINENFKLDVDVQYWSAISEQTNLIVFTTMKIDAEIQEMYSYVTQVAEGNVDRDSAVFLVINKTKEILPEIEYLRELTKQILELDHEFSHPITKHFNAALKQQKLLIAGYSDYIDKEIKAVVHILKNRDLNIGDLSLLHIESLKRAIKMSQMSQGLKHQNSNAMAKYNEIMNPNISKLPTNHYASSIILIEEIDELIMQVNLNYMLIASSEDEGKNDTQMSKLIKNVDKLITSVESMKNEIKLGRAKINYFDEMYKKYGNKEEINKIRKDIKDIFKDGFNQIEKMKDDAKRMIYFITPEIFLKDDQSIDKTLREMETYQKNSQANMIILQDIHNRSHKLVKSLFNK